MRRWVKNAFTMVTLCVATVAGAASPQTPKTPASNEQAALEADPAFLQATFTSDKVALDKLLDPDFTWTDADGKTLSRGEVLTAVPKPSMPYLVVVVGTRPQASENADHIKHNYGQIETIQAHQAHRGKNHVLRVWVKRPAGWRLLVYQEVRLMDAPPAASTASTTQTCENPCKTVPYQPKSQNEQDVLAGYMALQTYTVTHDSANWGKYVADEFSAANSNSNQTLDKRGRMEDLERSKMAGYSPMPVVHMRIFDFGNAAILVTQHQPERGKPVHITRVWIKRDGQWLEAASYQTRIEAAPAE